MSELPCDLDEYLKTASPVNAHLVRAFVSGYLKGVVGERTSRHQSLTDDEVALWGFIKAKEFLVAINAKDEE